METDLNNRVYATALSVMIQEHLQIISEGTHPKRGNGCWTCQTCEFIELMDKVGTLTDIIVNGLYEKDLREYYGSDAAVESWWDWKTDTANTSWLKTHAYNKSEVPA